MKRVISTTAAAALLVTGFSAVPVYAGGDEKAAADKPMPRKVSYRDLDLTTEAGERKLRKRLSSAAYGVCTSDSIGRFVGVSAVHRYECHAEVMAGLEPKVASLIQDRRMAAVSGKAAPALATASLSVSR